MAIFKRSKSGHVGVFSPDTLSKQICPVRYLRSFSSAPRTDSSLPGSMVGRGVSQKTVKHAAGLAEDSLRVSVGESLQNK
jgi:hypothetical protein